MTEIGRSVELAGPDGVDALLLVLSLSSRVTEEDVATIELLAAVFGPAMFERTVLVWTHAAALNDSSFEQYLSGASPRLQLLVDTCHASVLVEHCLQPGTAMENADAQRVRLISSIASARVSSSGGEKSP